MRQNFPRESSLVTRLSESEFSQWIDLAFVAAAVPAVSTAFLWLPEGSPTRTFLVLPFLFFFPGYSVVAALYPQNGRHEYEGRLARLRTPIKRRIDRVERLVLGIGVSVALVPILGVFVSFLGIPLTTFTMVVGVDVIVVLGVVTGFYRRLRLPESERFSLPFWPALNGLFRPFAGTQSRRHRLLTGLLIVLVICSLAGFGYGLVAKPSAERYTGLSVVTETDSGEYVAGGYPTNLTRGENASMVVGIENHEGRTVTYTVVPVVQRVDRSGEEVTVREQRRLEPIRASVGPNETAYRRHTFTPRTVGEDLRLAYVLYRGDPPRSVTVNSGYRHVHLWITVTPPNGTAANGSASLPAASEKRDVGGQVTRRYAA